jgi:hypothetical protein
MNLLGDPPAGCCYRDENNVMRIVLGTNVCLHDFMLLDRRLIRLLDEFCSSLTTLYSAKRELPQVACVNS